MERIINLHVEKLPEGVYLATSEEVQGLVAQGRTIQETIEIARDVAKKLLEAQHQIWGQSRRNQESLRSPQLADIPPSIGNTVPVQ
jgi:predicted RNase H-like HicB family nuclease